jgi:ferredoxin-thioredoxin reductase catalytic subunit
LITMEKVRQRAEADARTYGYYLNPDSQFLQDLMEGLKKNEERYGYPSCPCRVASGSLELDRDIICPCDYRDPDVLEFGTCYCALYMRKDLHDGTTSINPIPERRPPEIQARAMRKTTGGTAVGIEQPIAQATDTAKPGTIGKRLWYCRQCGYVVYREEPPYVCPICKAKKEVFTEIRLATLAIG